MAFDYEAHDTPDDIVRGIAAEMSDSVLKPLTDVEIAEREEWRRDYLARQEQERLAAERHRLEQERERQAVAQHEQALVTAKLREKAAADRQQQLDRELQRRDMLDMRMAAARADSFQHDVRTAHAQSVKQQYTNSLMGQLEQAINQNAPLTKPSPSFSELYRQNQRSGLYWAEPEDSDGGDK